MNMDEFRRRADECRCLAAAARNASDRNFWLGRVERWQALEHQNARLRANLSPGHRFGGSPKPQVIDGLGPHQCEGEHLSCLMKISRSKSSAPTHTTKSLPVPPTWLLAGLRMRLLGACIRGTTSHIGVALR